MEKAITEKNSEDNTGGSGGLTIVPIVPWHAAPAEGPPPGAWAR